MTITRSILGEPSSGRRKVLALATLLLLLLVIRLIWGAWSGRKADAALAALRARGEAVETADVTYPDVPDEENAWEAQKKALRGLALSSPRHSSEEFSDFPPYPANWRQLAAASESANPAAFAAVRAARQLSRVQFRKGLTSPVTAMLLTHLNGVRALANTLADGIAFAQETGDDGEAVERSLDLLHLARSIRHEEFVISQLVAIGIESMACRQIQSIAPGLRLDANAASRPATAEQARRLIDMLLDERYARQGLRRSMATERIVWIETCRARAQGTWVVRPLSDHAILRGFSHFESVREALAADTMPAALKVLKRAEELVMDSFSVVGASDPVVPRYSRWFDGYDLRYAVYVERNFRAIGERRATAVSLACQLYRADHARWPERLEVLVPKYLSRVPADPFFEDGRAIQYVVYQGALPGGGNRPMLIWFDDELDYGPPAQPTYGWHHDRTKPMRAIAHRQYRDVSRFVPPPTPPSPPPSTQAVQNDPQKANAPRQQKKPDDQHQ